MSDKLMVNDQATISKQESEVLERTEQILASTGRAFNADQISPLWPHAEVTMEELLSTCWRTRSWSEWHSFYDTQLHCEIWSEVDGYDPVSSEAMRIFGSLNLPEAVLIAAHNRLFGFKTKEPCQLAVELIAMALFNNDHNTIRVRGAWRTWAELVTTANRKFDRKHKAQAQIAGLLRDWG